MPQRISPNRRRSIAVLGNGSSTSSKVRQRRRAYSMIPGEKLSPATRARNLAPRKSILKRSLSARPSQESTSTSISINDGPSSTDATMTMDFTEVRPSLPRKSLGFSRRVSFASHAHVRMFEKPDRKDNARPHFEDEDEEREENEDEVEDSDEGASFEEDAPPQRNSRRRSSTGFTELGEQSMDMDDDDTGPIPQDFLGGASLNEEKFDDDSYVEDMDMTEVMPGGVQSLSTLVPRRRSSVAPVVTSSSTQSENQVVRRPLATISQKAEPQPQRELYPSLEDVPDPSLEQSATPNEDPDAGIVDDPTDMDLTMGSTAEPTISSTGEGDTQPMEFTIPVVRPPAPPSKLWLELRAMTHAGAEEPYAPPEMESSDDPEANAIVPSQGYPATHAGSDGDSMDLTVALNRLTKARPSLGLPPLSANPGSPGDDPEDDEPSYEHEAQDETFTSNEDSLDISLDGNQTVNLTQLRMSLGGRQSMAADTTMEFTNIYGGGLSTPAVADQSNEGVLPSSAPVGELGDEQQAERPSTPPAKSVPAPKQIFTLSKPAASHAPSSIPPSSAISQDDAQPQQPSKPAIPLPVFSLPPKSQDSSLGQTATKPPQPRPSPGKAPHNVTVPIPFTFTLPSRLNTRASPAKQAPPTAKPPTAPASPSKLPIFKGTAAFAPPTAPKSPLKRPAPPDEGDRDAPPPAKRQASEKLVASRDAPQPSGVDAQHNRRLSAVRRPSGYFAQRKSLGGANTQPVTAVSSLSQSSSTPALSNDLSRTSSPSPTIPAQRSDATSLPPSGPHTDNTADNNSSSAKSASPLNVPDIRVERASSPASDEIAKSTPPPEPRRSPRVSFAPIPAPEQPRPRDKSPYLSTRSDVANEGSQERSAPETITEADNESDHEIGEGEEDMELTEQWRDGINAGDVDDDEPTISIEQFFEMTNIRFMDEITAPRRSMILPGHLGMRNRRRSLTSAHSEETESIPLAEFMTAMAVDVPQLELYHDLASQLTGWVDESKKICRQAEEDAIKVTPALFREFAEVDELEKQDLLHQLKLIKANNIDSAKSQWYDWKSTWVTQLQESAEEAFAELENDAKTLEDIIGQAQTMLPALRDEYAQIMAELEKEEADIAEIENSDKNFLSDLKVSIAEQDVEVQALHANVSEAQAKLDRLKERSAEISSQKQEQESAISHGKELVQRQTESTSSEVLRLKNELEALEDLHLWRAVKLGSDLKEFLYSSRFRVLIPCVSHKPDVSRLTVERTKASRMKERDEFPELTELMLQCAPHIAAASGKGIDLRMIIQRLSDFWTSCAQIRLQLTFLAVQYPLELKLQTEDSGLPVFRVSAKVLFPSTKSKADITFVLDADTYSRWPLSIGLLKCEVKVVYGRADRQKILEAVQSRLSQATSSENHGCLLDACIEATEQLAFA
ncbi:hypothetical protein BDW22DRAFT_1483249 [Trametopsis cervina]|nr:hypothetical protein BDW22DRAFT_1483249 [Trametopsis cervina]